MQVGVGCSNQMHAQLTLARGTNLACLLQTLTATYLLPNTFVVCVCVCARTHTHASIAHTHDPYTHHPPIRFAVCSASRKHSGGKRCPCHVTHHTTEVKGEHGLPGAKDTDMHTHAHTHRGEEQGGR